MTQRWPNTLPLPQVESEQLTSPAYVDSIDVLQGPTRVRLARRNLMPSYSFTVLLNAAQAEYFEGWYWGTALSDNGEMYLPWIGGGRVVVFADEYQMTPLGLGWTLQGLVVQTRTDPTLCDAHIDAEFGLVRDTGPPLTDTLTDNGTATDIVKDDFPLSQLWDAC